MTKKTLFISVVIFGLLSMISCQKDNQVNFKSIIAPSILDYESADVLMSELEHVLAIDSLPLLIAYENRHGRVSIGRLSDSLIENTNPEEFNSFEDIREFCEINSDLVELVSMRDGSYEVNPKFDDTPLRYLANRDGLFSVAGTTFYKLIKDVVVVTTSDHLGELIAMTENDLSSIDTSDFKIMKDISLHVNHNNCCNRYTYKQVSTNSADKLVMELVTSASHLPVTDNQFLIQYTTRFKAHTCHKFWGVWWRNKHTVNVAGYLKTHLKVGEDQYQTETYPISYSQKAISHNIPINCIIPLERMNPSLYHYVTFMFDVSVPGVIRTTFTPNN